MTGSELIQFSQVQKKFGDRLVFQGLTGSISRGEFVSFLGPSGCGKSTFLRILGSLESVTSGEVKAPGQCSFVFQEPRLLPWRTCLENVLLPANLKKIEPPMSEASQLLNLLRLKDAQSLFPHQLSGGMKMRTAIARSLLLQPDFLLMDEPFSALDEEIRMELQLELRSLSKKNGWTVAFVTHSLEEALFLSDRIFIFHPGKSGLTEWTPQLPEERSQPHRQSQEFFNELRRLRIEISKGRS